MRHRAIGEARSTRSRRAIHADPRVAEASAFAYDGQLTQYLAGVPARGQGGGFVDELVWNPRADAGSGEQSPGRG
jgi:hypothetical protein